MRRRNVSYTATEETRSPEDPQCLVVDVEKSVDFQKKTRRKSTSWLQWCCRISTYVLLLSVLVWAVSWIQILVEEYHYRSIQRVMDKRKTACARPAWQKLQFPTCNLLHEIDLPHLEQRHATGSSLGFLANGYWRDVWAVDSSSSYNNETAVLKIMRLKHDIDAHNFDRHRRDGLVMERLTASPHVIDPYGFCGNSVLTEFLSKTLDKVAKGLDPSLVKYTRTRLDRLQLALGAARGLAALHEIPGGPIIHVDLGARQFLVGEDGNVKINDFNRCRFMGYYKTTKQPCDFRIQIAPGTDRAPEEYRELPSQNEKLDLFSFGNVLYIILTGREPWPYYYWGYAEPIIQRLIIWGIKPSLPQRVRRSDPELSELMYLLYALNPDDRPSAADVVRSIERILDKENVAHAISLSK
ncbi:hypothetical protein FisN_29Lh055 [Fistulifera solaris]|uniref:Protein kinase domain-containing protein n=1 Tax=Fistulifera solaris TaxID=1519565 RepID=A0A1Z5JLQ6_FISSO|nr:hypothetical protein FisN_29Lh055 [Fistulifera solaris]|eukprot:GAX14846.1 hypothetical protein FisN_29Lh055 [Fistulifera solaris]